MGRGIAPGLVSRHTCSFQFRANIWNFGLVCHVGVEDACFDLAVVLNLDK